ncbi:hypothetical protein ORS3428_28225 [Mesorhizobium sp. ORS 3428]|nr:hypothetical protein ORS3428_28225 [Mesorhizobium sp. ORS 3428]
MRQLTKGLFFVAPTRSQAFPESSAGAVAIGNLLAALAIAKLGDPAYDRISRNEKFIVSSGEYMLANRRSRKRSKKE